MEKMSAGQARPASWRESRHWATREKKEGGDIEYDVHALWRLTGKHPVLSLSRERIPDLLFDIICWDDASGNPITPRDVLVSEGRSPGLRGHWERILSADLSHPILVQCDAHTHQPVDVLDGMHRLCKAWLTKQKAIMYRCVSKKDLRASEIAGPFRMDSHKTEQENQLFVQMKRLESTAMRADLRLARKQQRTWTKADAVMACEGDPKTQIDVHVDGERMPVRVGAPRWTALINEKQLERVKGGHWFYTHVIDKPRTGLVVCFARQAEGNYKVELAFLQSDNDNSIYAVKLGWMK